MTLKKVVLVVFLLTSILGVVRGDIYLHNPRGSNNRLDERTANRQNNNRLFDSQNNNRGGYNVGDVGSEPAGGNADLQYQMKYFQSTSTAGSYLDIEWTMQHGCGKKNEKDYELECNVVLQYMCQDQSQTIPESRKLRDGVSTDSQKFTQVEDGNADADCLTQEAKDVETERGLHENWRWYDKCQRRDRNRGLFTADVKLKKDSAISTRQNPNGDRSGYECPEERDYYPYWHPTPWKDIAVLTSKPWLCEKIKQRSFNTNPLHECVKFVKGCDNSMKSLRWNNKIDCEGNGGSWIALLNYLEKAPKYKTQKSCESQTVPGTKTKLIWGLAYDGDGRTQECLVPLSAPECSSAPWSRSNHLGNGRNGSFPVYTWALPYFPSGNKQKCLLRTRYNISTLDYDTCKTDWRSNRDTKRQVVSPITKNPLVEIGGLIPLKLTINTQQTGRTFQDRSHVFELVPRPVDTKQRLFNLNVRGKRGNIVQAFPAVEYDFVPKRLTVSSQDLVHIQWTGSNTHNNNPGEAAGEGTKGTDRTNFVPIATLGYNYPSTFERTPLWKNAQLKWIYHGNMNVSAIDVAIDLATAGYYRCSNKSNCPKEKDQFIFGKKDLVDPLLNNAPASYPGIVIQMKKGEYHFMCTRNNNFSNRSQKGTIIVK